MSGLVATELTKKAYLMILKRARRKDHSIWRRIFREHCQPRPRLPTQNTASKVTMTTSNLARALGPEVKL